MNPTYHTIENQFADWGRTQRQLPQNNEVLKSTILAKLTFAAPSAPRKINWAFPWMSLVLAGSAVILFIISLPQNGPTKNQPASLQKNSSLLTQSTQPQSIAMNSGGTTFYSEAISPQLKVQPYASDVQLPPNAGSQVPGTDNREFIKTDYFASAQTRHVIRLSEQVQTAVRGFGGRVDSANNSKDSSYISFVVPENKFGAFRTEMKNLFGEKFIAENLYSQNLLPEKRSIEEQQYSAQTRITLLEAEKEKLTAEHNRTVLSIKAQLAGVAKELKELDAQLPPWSEEYQQRQKELLSRRAGLQRQLADENTNYKHQLSALDAQIKNAESELNSINKQDDDLLDTVATVRGTISISSINWLQMVNAYFALYWIALILFGLAVVNFFFRHRTKFIIP